MSANQPEKYTGLAPLTQLAVPSMRLSALVEMSRMIRN